MIAKTLSFGSPGRLYTKLEQLIYEGNDGAQRSFPIEDLGFVIIENKLLTVSAAALQRLAATNVALIICDDTHTPSAQLYPYTANTTTQEVTKAQFAATKAVNGRLWRQIVRQKILNQSALMKRLNAQHAGRLKTLAAEVKNYDETNCEAQAARIYFQTLVPDPDFIRDREGIWPNCALNYGYAILRAAVARALIGSGLLCIRGIHHHNRYNAFCLADDIMEPYRPFIDQYVLGKVRPFDVPLGELSKEMRSRLLEALTCTVTINGSNSPLMVALSYTSSSLAKYYLGKSNSLVLPEL